MAKRSLADLHSDTCLTSDEFEACHVTPTPGKALVVGSRIYETRTDRRKRYADAIGVDMLDGPGVDFVVNLEYDIPYHLGPFAHCDLISVLEHSKQPWRLTKNLEWLLPKGASLYVQAPFIWRIHSYPSDYFRFSIDGIKALFEHVEWKQIQYVHGLPQEKPPTMRQDNVLWFGRTEVCAFGFKV